jgi:hypothetical protein
MSVDIFGTTINPEIFLYTSIWLLLLTVVLWLIRYFFLRRSLFKLCGVPSSNYNLLATSLIWPKRSIKLRKNRLRGSPGTIYLGKKDKTAYVCQYNPRIFKGRPKVRERYQMLLFMGIVKEQYNLADITGAIRYQDHLENIKFEPTIYKDLLDLQDEYSDAIKEWVAPDKQPLFKREKYT